MQLRRGCNREVSGLYTHTHTHTHTRRPEDCQLPMASGPRETTAGIRIRSVRSTRSPVKFTAPLNEGVTARKVGKITNPATR
eukprot:5210693-Pyramimonas_sp.AAC.1